MSKLGPLHLSNNSGPRHTGTVIFFHGSGDDGENLKDWVRLMAQKKPFEFSHLRVLYPTAPTRPYIPLLGNLSRVWFNRYETHPQVPEHLETLNDIEDEVKRLIAGENDVGIPNNRIIVGGFSMGGALALHTAYRWVPNLAGCFAYSSFLNDDSVLYKHLKDVGSVNPPPLLQIHGDADKMVMLEWGRKTHERLKELGVNGEFHEVPKLGHSLSPRGIHIIDTWIRNVLPENECV